MVKYRKGLLLLVVVVLCLLCGYFGQSAAAYASSYTTSNYSGQSYTIINTITVSNPTASAVRNVKVTVPLISKTDLGSWQFFSGEELNPKPEQIIVNGNNGRDATYNIGQIAAKSSVKLVQKFQVTNYAMSSSFNFKDYVYNAADLNKINKKYLQPEDGIESDDTNIIAYAQSKTAGYTNPYLMAKSLFSDINLYLTYDNSITSHSAVKALQSGRGNCVDYACLYTACLRSLGIPARIYTGYWYSPDIHGSSEFVNADGTVKLEELKHNWVEFYIAGMGWVVADPTFTYRTLDADGNYIKSVDWSRFAEITNSNRLLTLYQGNDSASVTYSGNYAPTVTYDSRLSVTESLSKFNDLVGHWAKEDVMELYHWSVPVVQGKSENYFGVGDDITRAELVTMINRILDYDEEMEGNNLRSMAFSDVSDNHWAVDEIKKAVSRGYVVGFADGTFKPEKSVSRAEMMAILNNIANLSDRNGSPFLDLDINGYKWAKGAIENCYNAGLAKGITAISFEPQKSLTRGEAAVFINRWIKSDYY